MVFHYKLLVFFYNLGLKAYYLALLFTALFNPKARKWLVGRSCQWRNIGQELDASTSYIWVHCASLGEFEQGRPVMEQIKENHPSRRILLTFFSPSGLEIKNDYELADYVYYLPLDSPQNAARFLDAIPIEMAIFVKYDIWYHYFNELQKRKIPSYLISAIFRPNQLYFKPYGSFLLEILKNATQIFVQNKTSSELLQKHGCTNVQVTGDSRLDRVLAINKSPHSYPIVESFLQGKKAIIFGSTWPLDEEIIIPYILAHSDSSLKFILAPHQIKKEHLAQLSKKLKALRYSKTKNSKPSQYQTLLIDNIGMLSSLYRYAKVAYVGGGFKTGLHNTMEPAVFGLPVIFGPKYHKFEEAKELIQRGGAFSIKNHAEFKAILSKLEEKEAYLAASESAKTYVLENAGASKKIVDYIYAKAPLTQ